MIHHVTRSTTAAELQALIDTAAPGDQIVFAPDAVITGNLIFRRRPDGSAPVTLRPAVEIGDIPPTRHEQTVRDVMLRWNRPR
jgi:hypothetical protein